MLGKVANQAKHSFRGGINYYLPGGVKIQHGLPPQL